MKYLKRFKIHSDYEEYINGKAVLPNVSYTEDILKVYYNPIPHDYSQDYFTMVVTVGGDVAWAGIENNALHYSKDNGKTWSEPSDGMTLSVNDGDKVLWKGTGYSSHGLGVFSGSTNLRYTVEGNVMSLLFGDDFKGQTSLEGKSYTFLRIFYNNKNITSAENLSLSATTLADGCYNAMFNGCSNLVYAPKVLPATTLAEYCYESMFSGCTSLVTAPELPATTLAKFCYYHLFLDCNSLNYIKCLARNISALNCLSEWVKNVASTGTFVKDASMTSWSTDINGIPTGWTVLDV